MLATTIHTNAVDKTNRVEQSQLDGAKKTRLRNFFSRVATQILSVGKDAKHDLDERAVLPAVLPHGPNADHTYSTATTTTTTTYCKQQQTTHNTCRFSVWLLITRQFSEVML